MHFRQLFSAALAAVFVGTASAIPMASWDRPGTWVLTANNTFNSTHDHSSMSTLANNRPANPLPLQLTNKFAGNNAVFAYLTGLDGDGSAFFLQPDGSCYYPPNPPAGQPPQTITQKIGVQLGAQGSTVTVNLPNYVTSGRIYFSIAQLKFAVNNGPNGAVVVAPSFTNPSDPNINSQYGFVEFTWSGSGGLYSNLSYVDFVGLVISQQVTGGGQTCTVKGLPSNAVQTICNGLSAQAAKDSQPWDKSCQKDQNGNVIRALAPLHLTEISNGALASYYSSYNDQVWSYYTNNVLTVGGYTGQVNPSTGLLTFNHGGTFAKPSITDIMGCNSGPFANPGSYMSGNQVENTARQTIVPRLCAAWHRSTLLLSGGNNQPDGVTTSQFYSVSPTNHYSRLVHAAELDGKGYAFAYDDVHASNAPDVSGLCVTNSPTNLQFIVGGAQ